jgi:drug/metabolite transporter (DMT)-like permease
LGLTVLIWGAAFLATKAAFSHFSVMAFVFVRFSMMTLMAFAILGVITHRKPGLRWTPRRSDWQRFLLVGLVGYTINGLGFNFGADHTSVFSASLLINTSPIFIIVILALIGERPPLGAWIGVAIAVAGVAVFLQDKTGGSHSLSGDLLCLISALSFAIYGIINRPLAVSYHASISTAWALLIGSIPLILLGVPAALEQSWATLPASSWLALGYMVVFPIYIAFMLWNYGIVHRGAAVASSFGLLVPVVSGILAALFFNESFGPTKLIGAALVLGGLLLIRVLGSRP